MKKFTARVVTPHSKTGNGRIMGIICKSKKDAIEYFEKFGTIKELSFEVYHGSQATR